MANLVLENDEWDYILLHDLVHAVMALLNGNPAFCQALWIRNEPHKSDNTDTIVL
jgi:hypothetical protein